MSFETDSKMAEPFIGQIMQVGFNYAPRGWALAQGQILSIAQNSAMFALLGTTFGGNGTQTFGLPDTRGRLMVGVGNGPGLQPMTWGEMSGVQNATLLISNMPQHNHTAIFQGTPGTTTASGTLSALQVPPASQSQQTGSPGAGSSLGTATDTTVSADVRIYAPSSVTGTSVNLAGLNVTGGSFTPQGNVTVGISGGGVPFSVLNPYVAVYTIIATEGIFPSRN